MASHSASDSWPSLKFEEILWDEKPVSGTPRAATKWLGRPYRAALTPEIATLCPTLGSELTALVEEAVLALATFDAEVGHQAEAFDLVLLRSESASSSQIENLSASARKIAEAELNGTGTEHALMIVANVRSMVAALEHSHSLNAHAVLDMHRALMQKLDPEIAGQFRDDQVWIGGRPSFGPGTPHEADFVPPAPTRVPQAIDDLLAFTARDDIPVLVQAAIAHAQFETIHPFLDGNGRTGRALVHGILRAKGVVQHISVPISGGILTDTAAYIQALEEYRRGNIAPIIECFAYASLRGVDLGRELVTSLQRVRASWSAHELAGLRADSRAHCLADGLLNTPVIDAHRARAILGIANNENRAINALVERGVLKEDWDYKSRNRMWRAPAVLEVLDTYARKAGRRTSHR